jgi:ketopantoate hydroxymethyltransferase
VALVAVTVRVEEAPAATVVGLAAMVTVGDVVGAVPAPTVPQPVTSRNKEQVMAIAKSDSIEQNREIRRGRGTRTVTMGLSFLFQVSDSGSTRNCKTWKSKEYKASRIGGGRNLCKTIRVSIIDYFFSRQPILTLAYFRDL